MMTRIANRAILVAAILLLIFITTLTPAGGQQAPREVVNLFLRVYGTEQMAEILPYTFPSFREGLTPKVWPRRTSAALDWLGYVRLDAIL